MATTAIPTRDDINVFDSLDERVAVEHFLGKTLDEAELLFEERLDVYEDLMWMGPRAFHYYVQAAINYLRSDAANGDSDALNHFAIVLGFWVEQAHLLAPIADRLALACDDIVAGYDRFQAEPEIYGDLRSRYVTLRERLIAVAP